MHLGLGLAGSPSQASWFHHVKCCTSARSAKPLLVSATTTVPLPSSTQPPVRSSSDHNGEVSPACMGVPSRCSEVYTGISMVAFLPAASCTGAPAAVSTYSTVP